MPVGIAELPEAGTEEATEEEDMAAEPNYAFAKGYGRFGMGYTRLATALGNFEQGNIQAESAVVAQWLTSGLRVAMSRTGWNLLSPRHMLTRVPSTLLSNYYCHGYPFSPTMEDRPYNQYGQQHKGEGIDIFFLCFLWLHSHCLSCSCTLVSMLIIKGTAPCDKGK